jgi:hypothetical protein
LEEEQERRIDELNKFAEAKKRNAEFRRKISDLIYENTQITSLN